MSTFPAVNLIYIYFVYGLAFFARGCGTCQAMCPKGAVFVSHFKLDQFRVEGAGSPRSSRIT